MKRITNLAAFAMLTLIFAAAISGCKKDNNPSTSYQLVAKDQLGVSGTITFTETSNSVTTVAISLSGADTTSHPAYIQQLSVIEDGPVAITLNPVVQGTSTTQVSTLDNGTPINYAGLIAYDGFANVIESIGDTGNVIAVGDIGGNALTSTSITYTLSADSNSGVSGTALLQKRNNGNSLLTISLTGQLQNQGVTYPATINIGDVPITVGPVTLTLNPVNGPTGKSYTTVRKLDSGMAISYASLVVYDGYLAIHNSTAQSPLIICEGNIGAH